MKTDMNMNIENSAVLDSFPLNWTNLSKEFLKSKKKRKNEGGRPSSSFLGIDLQFVRYLS